MTHHFPEAMRTTPILRSHRYENPPVVNISSCISGGICAIYTDCMKAGENIGHCLACERSLSNIDGLAKTIVSRKGAKRQEKII
jgi:hypothetical protein